MNKTVKTKKDAYAREMTKKERQRAIRIMEKEIPKQKDIGEISEYSWHCEVCGAVKAVAHHGDYSKPLDITWLCPLHHRVLHGIQKYGLGA